jgi:hypothetical protein
LVATEEPSRTRLERIDGFTDRDGLHRVGGSGSPGPDLLLASAE